MLLKNNLNLESSNAYQVGLVEDLDYKDRTRSSTRFGVNWGVAVKELNLRDYNYWGNRINYYIYTHYGNIIIGETVLITIYIYIPIMVI